MTIKLDSVCRFYVSGEIEEEKNRNERTGIFPVSAPLNSFLLNIIFLLPGRLLSSTLSGCTLAL